MAWLPSQETFDGTMSLFSLHVISLLYFNPKGIYTEQWPWSWFCACDIPAGSQGMAVSSQDRAVQHRGGDKEGLN